MTVSWGGGGGGELGVAGNCSGPDFTPSPWGSQPLHHGAKIKMEHYYRFVFVFHLKNK